MNETIETQKRPETAERTAGGGTVPIAGKPWREMTRREKCEAIRRHGGDLEAVRIAHP